MKQMEKTVSKSFWQKFRDRCRRSGSVVCIGLDSQLEKLPKCVLDSHNPIWEFNKAIIDSTHRFAAAYKPNLAFYIADGMRGMEALQKTIVYIPPEIPIIIDCKVGDIGSTMQGYVKGFFQKMKADAITVNPLMGRDVIKPIMDIEDSFAFVLALTSNKSAEDFFHAENLKEKIPLWMKEYGHTRIGAVVGATQVKDLKLMRELMPERIFLIPGIGAQGGDLQAVLKNTIYNEKDPRILINSSRGIIFAGSDDDFDYRALKAAEELYEACKM